MPLRPRPNNLIKRPTKEILVPTQGNVLKPTTEILEKVELQMLNSSNKAALSHSNQILGESITLNLDSLLLTPGPLNTIPIEPQSGESKLNTAGALSSHNKTAQPVLKISNDANKRIS